MGDKVDQTMGGHGCWTEGFVLHFVLDVGNPGRVSAGLILRCAGKAGSFHSCSQHLQ